jgi:hypothetical protein
MKKAERHHRKSMILKSFIEIKQQANLWTLGGCGKLTTKFQAVFNLRKRNLHKKGFAALFICLCQKRMLKGSYRTAAILNHEIQLDTKRAVFEALIDYCNR